MPKTLHVSKTADGAFRSIAAALEAAAADGGARILLDAGEYAETLVIRGEIELVAPPGENGAAARVVATGGITAECDGTVTFRNLTLVNYGGTVLKCAGGTLALRNCEVHGQGTGAVGVLAERGTELAIHACAVRSAEVTLSGASATVTDSRFTASRDSAIAVMRGSSARISGCTISDTAAHAVRVNGSTAHVEQCDVSRAGFSALSAVSDSTLTAVDCTVHDVHKEGIVFRSAGGTVRRCRVEGAERGIWINDDARATVSDTAFADCRIAGIAVDTRATARLEDCVVTSPGRYGISVGEDARPTGERIEVTGGEFGVWTAGGRGRFTGLTLRGNDIAIRLDKRSYARFEELTVEDCGLGVEAFQDETSVEIVDASIAGPRRGGVSLAGQARLTAERCTVSDARETAVRLAGGSAATAKDCTVSGGAAHGVVVADTARLDAVGLTVAGCAETGVWGRDSARVALRDSELSGSAKGDLRVEDSATEQVEDSAVGTAHGAALRRANRLVTGVAGAGRRGDGPARPAPAPADSKPLTELSELIGLAPVKRQVRSQINMIRLAQHRAAAGLPAPELSRHLVFSGPPGTGKTTVARLYGQILASLGVLANGEVHEVTRSQMVGQYLGSTAQRTREEFTKAVGGVLFIDEAYSLARTFGVNSDFGQEAIDELVTLMETRREDVVVIAAGYTDEMNTFLEANPGLRSRFSRTIEFPPYSPEELVRITELMARKGHFTLDEELPGLLRAHFDRLAAAGKASNAREARTLFEAMVEQQAERLSAVAEPTVEQLMLLLSADFPEGTAGG
ncbi:right-handed parallel beta-helix repeat-containing protein [Streptomyces litchfieldiae]|uniref:Right-handed parallel beta-helix repeat-containing protein n=1 Tax=Streptomyces litchfieldiae TaxID=3075543 RepID=A0ABU2MQP0_9ACTN|nr:right-handed parallel beta-helix repeat-containing protein [Streptomyces sp. DSM 44938]MDT0343786.1 right-handed parallel beta-helix repeat-containing protein [Streptomyces sp. DSM 44938]